MKGPGLTNRGTKLDLRYASGAAASEYTFNGQYTHVDDFGLVYFKARWLDAALGRFAQADSLIPGAGDSQAWDRYAFALNNPVRYSDPSGHWAFETDDPIHKVSFLLTDYLVSCATHPARRLPVRRCDNK